MEGDLSQRPDPSKSWAAGSMWPAPETASRFQVFPVVEWQDEVYVFKH